MAQTDGEKEIVLGNKQLISLFFVVVALLGVFFAAGYMIGRKSVSPVMTGDAAPKQESEPPRETSPDAPASQPVASQTSGGTSQEPAGAGTETQPDRTSPERIAKLTRPETAEPNAEKPARRVSDTAVTKPEPGATYLQVTALRRPDADNLVRSLREQNFPATLAESSKEGLLRVLVGPYHETSRVAEAKAKLKALGFANAFVQR